MTLIIWKTTRLHWKGKSAIQVLVLFDSSLLCVKLHEFGKTRCKTLTMGTCQLFFTKGS